MPSGSQVNLVSLSEELKLFKTQLKAHINFCSRRVQELAQQSQTMERETWDSLLSFLLAINDALLAPPAVKDDVGDQLCERVLGVLYEIWLIACVKSFPGPTLWKTFQVWLIGYQV